MTFYPAKLKGSNWEIHRIRRLVMMRGEGVGEEGMGAQSCFAKCEMKQLELRDFWKEQ